MRRIVGEIKSAFEGKRTVTGIIQSRPGRANQAVELLPVWWLPLYLADVDKIFKVKGCHFLPRSKIFSVAL